LNEAGLNFDQVKVDLKTHRTEEGRDYALINAKGRWVDVADQGSTAYALWTSGATPPQGLFM
jgi:hypothetical protein